MVLSSLMSLNIVNKHVYFHTNKNARFLNYLHKTFNEQIFHTLNLTRLRELLLYITGINKSSFVQLET